MRLSEDEPIPMDGTVIILHAGQAVVHLINVELTPDLLKGEIPRFPITSEKEREVHIYTTSDFQLAADSDSVKVPLTWIDRVETWQVDRGATAAYTILGILGITALVLLVLLAIVAATKGASCPFIYAFDGESYILSGEVFSGAIHPPLERHDYLKLPSLAESDGEYRIKITNEVEEIQHTNLAELIVVDHPEGSEVFIDKYGSIHNLYDQRPPSSAVDSRGKDVLSSVASIDNVCFAGDVIGEDSCLVQKVHMTFDMPTDTDEQTSGDFASPAAKARMASLRVRARNTMWLDYAYKQLYARFGSAYPLWLEKKKHESADRLTNWSRNQSIPLSVSVKKNGKWELVDYFNIAGPLAMKDDVLSIDISDVVTDRIEIMLSFGSLFWEIDYVTVDFTADCVPADGGATDPDGERTPGVVFLKPVRADDPQRGDISALIVEDDDLYYDQPCIGDEAVLTFSAFPETAFGTVHERKVERSFFLHSKGHYEIIINPTGDPDIEFLTGFTEPLRFTRFSRDLFLRNLRSSGVNAFK